MNGTICPPRGKWWTDAELDAPATREPEVYPVLGSGEIAEKAALEHMAMKPRTMNPGPQARLKGLKGPGKGVAVPPTTHRALLARLRTFGKGHKG